MNHRRTLLFILAALVLTTGQAQEAADPPPVNPHVEVETSLGSFVIELDIRRAPLTVENFLHYVENGHYEGTIFHRVIEGFIAQAGGYDAEFNLKETPRTVANESGNGLANQRGTVGLARTSDPHSGNAQFYLNLANNSTLNPNSARWGYAVFGRTIKGMEVMDAIGHVGTGPGGKFPRDVPSQTIAIKKMTVLPVD